jgi:hypothetical protein
MAITKFVMLLFLMFGGIKDTGSATVYICGSPNAKKYHLKSICKGLSNCTYRIKKTTLTAAKQSGKTICLWED